MTTRLDPTLLPALESIYSLLDARPAPVRHYAPVPAVDYHVDVFRRLCERDQAVRELVSGGVSEQDDPRDAEAYFLEQQCPPDSAFR